MNLIAIASSPSNSVAIANSFSTSGWYRNLTWKIRFTQYLETTLLTYVTEEILTFPPYQTHKSKGFRPRLLHECHLCTVVRGFYSRTHTSYWDKRETRIRLLFENHNFFLLHYLMSIHLRLGAVSHFLSWSSFISLMKLSLLFTVPRCKHDLAESHFEFRILPTEVWTVGFEK